VHYVCSLRFASLNESVVCINEVREVDAVGYIGAAVSSNGNTADIMLSALANNGQEVEQFFTNNTVQWNSPSAQWTDSGRLAVFSAVRVIQTTDWIVNAMLQYGNSLYSVLVSDYGTAGNQLFLASGDGAYGGNWNKW